jgi:hypothetical protein
MHNPIAVFLFSCDHKFKILSKIYSKIGLYSVIHPYPFEHYCVFCAKYVDYCWWHPKEYFIEKQELIEKIVREKKTNEGN